MPPYQSIKILALLLCLSLSWLVGCGEKKGTPPNAATTERGLMRLPEEAAAFQREGRVAVVVGINAYAPESGFRTLDYAKEDAQALDKQFSKYGYTVRPLLDGQAKKSFILKAIEEAGKQLEPGQGTLVFAFTGHGFAGAAGNENYLVVDGTSDFDLEASGLKLSDVTTALKKTGARRIMVFIDACRDNPLIGKSVSNPGFAQLADSDGLNILYATAQGEVSVESPQLQHGVFTHFLLEGLDGAAAKNNLILFDTLADYVTERVKEYSFKNPPNKTQKPYRSGESSGQFLIATLPASTIPPDGVKPSIPPVASAPNNTLAVSIQAYRKNDFPLALQHLRPLAAQNDGTAQFYIARMYSDGNGVTKDEDEARKWFNKAIPLLQTDAKGGMPEAQYSLGWMYDKGAGVAQSGSEAINWYQKAAGQGHEYAQNWLGVRYLRGKGVTQSVAEAAKWFQKAANQGNVEAQNNLCWMYMKGKGVRQSNTEAAKWCHKAAVQGQMSAQNNLCWMYMKGKGVRQSNAEAAEWCRKAAAQGHPYAQKRLKLLKK